MKPRRGQTVAQNGYSSPLRISLASSNPGKLHEFGEAASGFGIIVESLSGFQGLPPCVEDGETFEENAKKKALHYAAFSRGLVLADDSGLAVDALGGAPGVYSARYAGAHATDEANNRKLIEELGRIALRTPDRFWGGAQAHPHGGFAAHYDCAIALAHGNRMIVSVEGRVDGCIVEKPRGSGGFGYDPYFLYPPFNRTFAEISTEEKFSVSHRGIAFRKLLESVPRNG